MHKDIQLHIDNATKMIERHKRIMCRIERLLTLAGVIEKCANYHTNKAREMLGGMK